MFAALVLERDPLVLRDLPRLIPAWLQIFGGFAMVGLVVWLLVYFLGYSRVESKKLPYPQVLAFTAGVVAAAVAYAVYFALLLPQVLAVLQGKTPAQPSPRSLRLQSLLLTVAGACALFSACLPFFLNLARLRFRRIWALAKLSFKDAIRRRALYAFSLLLLVFLFASWFIPSKAEDQIRTYVQVVYWAEAPLLLLVAVILAAFSIPTDVRQQTIHTVLTKPVERFEVVLGRFLGFVALMTLVLLVMTGVSLIYVLRGVDPQAAAESLKARMPLYGGMHFEGTSREQGDSVGDEWEYRGWITYNPSSPRPQAAVWNFSLTDMAASVAERDRVRCEFTFDIYRTTKGRENRGISCKLIFTTWQYPELERQGKSSEAKYRERRRELLAQERGKPNPRSELDIDNELCQELGYYEVPAKEVFGREHTEMLEIPGGLFRKAREGGGAARPDALRIRVECTSQTMYLGMAKNDLYFRLDNPQAGADTFWFSWNFVKGAGGLWFRLCLVIGVAVTLSTYLSGVISLLVAMLLYLGGLCQGFIRQVAEGSAEVGHGPMEAFWRLATRQPIAAPMEDSPIKTVTTHSDEVFRWLVRRLMNLIPDVEHFDLTQYVAEGFNYSVAAWNSPSLLMNLILLAGYLFPCGVLAFYMLRWREVAAST
jgi:hypothetical protein